MKKSRIINVLVILALVLSLILPATTTVSAAGIWVMQSGTMSTQRTYLASAVVNGKIYAIGGDGHGYTENYTIEEYTPGSGWVVKAVSHIPRAYFSAAVVNNKIYIIGGSHQGVPYQYDNAVEEYDPASNQTTLTLKAPMSVKRQRLGVAVVDNKIYAIGGFNETGTKNIVEVYDPSDTSNGYDSNGNPMGKWTTQPHTMPTAKDDFSIAVANGKIYTIAGYDMNGVIKKVEEYIPSSDTWIPKTDLSILWDTQMATSFNDKVYVAGGGIGGVYGQKVVKEYDPIADTWKDMPNMLKGRSNGELAYINNKLYAFGGDDQPYGQIEMLDDVNDYCARWPLDRNGNDVSGNGNNGTLVGNPTTVTGVINQALSFNGSNYVNIPDSPTVDFGTGDFSISFWVKTSSTITCNTLIEKRSSTYVGYDVSIYGGRILLQMGDPSGYTSFMTSSSPLVNNGVWHHVVITVDRDNTSGIKFYCDGAYACSYNPTVRPGDLSNSEPLYIGKHRDWPSSSFIGTADDIRFYKRVLSDSEILQLSTP